MANVDDPMADGGRRLHRAKVLKTTWARAVDSQTGGTRAAGDDEKGSTATTTVGFQVMDDEDASKPSRRKSLSASVRRAFEEAKNGLRSRSSSSAAAASGRSTPTRRGGAGAEDDVRGINGITTITNTTTTTAAKRKSKLFPRTLSEPATADSALGPPFSTMPQSMPVVSAIYQGALSPVSEQLHQARPPMSDGPKTELKPTEDLVVPELLQLGTPMMKISAKKQKKFVFRLDPDLGQIEWESKQRHKIIPIENIKEIRSGHDGRYYREQFQLSQEYEDRWLTIIYILDGTYKTLHLVVATKDVFRLWDNTLRQLHAIRQELMSGLGNREVRQAIWEKQYWKGADEGQDQRLSFEEVEKLCKRLSINSSREDLYRLFKQADKQKRNFLDFDDFCNFVKMLKNRPEIRRLYEKQRAKNQSEEFDFGVFEAFMRETQESTLGLSELQELFLKYTSGAPTMSMDAFSSFLLSQDNSAALDQHPKVHHDMTRPLPEYFISSSHNTYLVGHQLVGDSTIEGYIRALLHSCRSVEVDVFDGDTEPMIFHGKTFTSKVSLRQVAEAIKKYGFTASPYPIIISAEMHCGLTQQDMVAEIMISVFGDSLIREPPEGRAKIESLPSPEDLKYKVLLKTKNLLLSPTDSSDGESTSTDPSASSASEHDTDFFDTGPESAGVKPVREQKPPPQARNSLSKVGNSVLQRVRSIRKPGPSSTPSADGNGVVAVAAPTNPKPKPKMSLALVALLVYTVGVKWRGLNKKEEYAPEHMFSLSENMANKVLKVGMMDLIKHTRSHLVRIYPKGTRVSSSNFEPHRFWAAGSQLVAINWQTFDLGYMINHAMFQRNGRSGYVLKPRALRTPNKELLAKRTQHVFQVSIISAQQLPRPKDALGHEIASRTRLDPFVEVSLYVPDWPSVSLATNASAASPARGLARGRSVRTSINAAKKGSSKSKSPPPNDAPNSDLGLLGSVGMSAGPHGLAVPLPLPAAAPATPIPSTIPGQTIVAKTGTVKNNGFNPVWEEKLTMPFECVGDMIDLVFVRFVVRCRESKEGDEPLAVYCASLGSLGRGYRHLALHDSQLSQFLFSTLFVHIKVLNVG